MRKKSGLPFIEPAQLGRPRWRFTNPIRPGEVEEIYEPLRDVLITVPNQALGKQTAYTNPIGANYQPLGGTTTYQKSRWDTNLQQAGQLPGPDRFQLEAVAIGLDPNTSPVDAGAWSKRMLCTLRIGSTDKRYVEDHPIFIPGGGGLHLSGTMFQASAAAASYWAVSNGWPIAHNMRVLGDSVDTGAQIIEQSQNFAFDEDPTLDNYDAAYSTATTTANPAGTGITSFYRLVGHWLRGVQ